MCAHAPLSRCQSELLSYGNAAGYQPLRKAIASYLTVSRGVRCDSDQIIVVSGTQQALHLIAQTLLVPGDPVWMEEPGYFAAQSVFEALGAQIIPVDVDTEGLKVEAGMAAHPSPRLVYTTPGHQFPLGVTMSVSR